MKTISISNINIKNSSFAGFYSNKHLLKGLKFASKNGALFTATTSLVLSAIARPLSIMSAPNTDKENKKLACAKSIASTIVGYGIMLTASLPVAKAIEQIDNKPQKYLTNTTVRNLQNGAKTLVKSKNYMLATQFFKLGLGLFIAIPKSIITNTLIAPIMHLFPQPKHQTKTNENRRANGKIISFKAGQNNFIEILSKMFGKIINMKPVQKLAKKYSDSNFAQHIMSLTDIVLTASIVQQIKNNKEITEKRKKPLIHNSIMSTAMCITGGYAINGLLKNPTEKFIRNFRDANKNLPELEKYVEGIKIAKPTLILGTIYYIFIPAIATFFSDKTAKTTTEK